MQCSKVTQENASKQLETKHEGKYFNPLQLKLR